MKMEERQQNIILIFPLSVMLRLCGPELVIKPCQLCLKTDQSCQNHFFKWFFCYAFCYADTNRLKPKFTV